MISCRIVLNELPDNVTDQVLCVDEVHGNPQWRIINESDVRRTFKFTPKPNAPSWFVRWGFKYSRKHFTQALRGRDEATTEWRNTDLAAKCDIPAVRYRLLGAPRLLTASLDTLLVTEHIEACEPVTVFLHKHSDKPLVIESLLRNIAGIVAQMHEHNILHRRLTLQNILIQYGDPSRLTVLNWQRMRHPDPDELRPFERDLVLPLQDLRNADLDENQQAHFVDTYAQRMPWAKTHRDQLLAGHPSH